MKHSILTMFIIILSNFSYSQNLTSKILNQNSEPIPFANIFIITRQHYYKWYNF
ncbi:MAG: hypothetical protein MJ211_13355 [Bacteroidales bacterium]|nr:hypothetical protein [Bacteroidales bacterium]